MANALLEEYEGQVLYISIHANAAFNQSASGFEVWHLPTDHNRELIDPNNVSEDQRPIIPILNRIMEEELTIEGNILAQRVLEFMDRAVGTLSENRGLRQMDWFVVRNARMPSILIELGFITNPGKLFC
jgi:N-acetylmuramoyl-L-alanine amidase